MDVPPSPLSLLTPCLLLKIRFHAHPAPPTDARSLPAPIHRAPATPPRHAAVAWAQACHQPHSNARHIALAPAPPVVARLDVPQSARGDRTSTPVAQPRPRHWYRSHSIDRKSTRLN